MGAILSSHECAAYLWMNGINGCQGDPVAGWSLPVERFFYSMFGRLHPTTLSPHHLNPLSSVSCGTTSHVSW